MRRRKAHRGECHICGIEGPLSFEHVPPRAAFNEGRWIEFGGEDALTLGPDLPGAKGKHHQGGVGRFALCQRCNNDTGSWYAPHFVTWCYRGIEILLRSEGRPSLFYLYDMQPLPTIKQIATMFFAINSPGFREAHPDLVRFVLDRQRSGLPPKYRFYFYLTVSPRGRYVGVAGRYDMRRGEIHVLSELSFPPFGYVLTFDSPTPEDELFEITHFAAYGYDERVDQWLRPRVLPVDSAFPVDYRTRDQILADAEQSVGPGSGPATGSPQRPETT